MRDFTHRYNTELNPGQEGLFQQWALDESRAQGRDVLNDLYDYDLRGMWLDGADFGGDNNHATDAFKKPNHPTFSNQSRYDGVDGYKGGVWQEGPNGFTYYATESNMYSPEELREYFKRAEQGNHVVFPKGLLDLLPED